MGDMTGISWCDHTFNGWVGCSRVSPGCVNCYADTQTARWNPGSDQWRRHGTRKVTSDANWRKPHQWNRAAEQAGVRRRVFASSLADAFEDRRDLDEPRARLFATIEQTPWLDWLLLTKRAGCIMRLAPWGDGWPPNVWMGVSAEDQRRLIERIGCLREIPAAVTFLSCEPLLGPISLFGGGCEDAGPAVLHHGGSYRTDYGTGIEYDCAHEPAISWVICGGESGPKARPMRAEWARSLRDECADAGVPFHFKQAGNVLAREWGCASRTGHVVSEWPEPFPQQFPLSPSAVSNG